MGRRAGILLLMSVLLPPAAGGAQDAVAVSGRVTDAASGDAVAGALLTWVASGRQAVTDEDGRFVFEGTLAGAHVLRVERYGYDDLTRPVAVAEGMAPLDLRLQAAPIPLDELTVTGNARADLEGWVVDAASGEAVPFARLTLTRSGGERVGRGGVSGEDGAFSLEDVEAGAYLIRAERLGYRPIWVPLFHGAPPEGALLRLEADSALLVGLRAMEGELELRRQAHWGSALVFDEARLRRAGTTGMRQFLAHNAPAPIVSCGEPAVRGCIRLRGRVTRPVVVIDGLRLPEPPSSPRLGASFGGLSASDLPPEGLEQFDTFTSEEFYSVEYFVCESSGKAGAAAPGSGLRPSSAYVEIHAYSYGYMERLAQDPRLPRTPCVP